ncbi:MAG: DNA-binding response regulator [Sulfobacillus thermosulfidooxidans]|uniref:response regulator transcription factor n=1 Tax=Sulfobacillus TaxID=28033 RepID=UPI000CCFF8E9|nr:response regulator transcription factor [Sulfobacillus sp. hq2]POB09769.1 DNA-binding response regulator [Sulfobacillus sp. hq2]PSR38088.1 MAG: DNA-binding response regulator [Sulfobacillus thermosulfidooxidans]
MDAADKKPVILLVDDEDHIRELCRLYLQSADFEIIEAADGLTALKKLEEHPVDLVVLDIMLPGLDGFGVLKAIRERQVWLPVVMLTAVGDEEDRIAGLEQGADDYLIKPFSPKELVARVRAVLRRTQTPQGPGETEILRFPGLMLDAQQRLATAGGEVLTLTPREFDLLWFLAQHPQQVFSRDQLLDRVWGFDFEGDGRTVDVHITRLRQKLLKAAADYQYVETVWGQGYRFKPHEREA